MSAMLILIALGVASLFVALPLVLGVAGWVIDGLLVGGFMMFIISGCSDFTLRRNIERTRRGK